MICHCLWIKCNLICIIRDVSNQPDLINQFPWECSDLYWSSSRRWQGSIFFQGHLWIPSSELEEVISYSIYKKLYYFKFESILIPQFVDPISTWTLILNFWFWLAIENLDVFFPQKVNHCSNTCCAVSMANGKLKNCFNRCIYYQSKCRQNLVIFPLIG